MSPAPPLVLISGKDPLAQMGGHESYVRAHALAAARLGYEPHILVVGRRPGTCIAPFGVVHRIAPPWPGGVPVALQIPLLARAAVRLLTARPGPHIVHGFAIWSASAVAAVRALGRRGETATAVASAYATRTYEITEMQNGLGSHLSSSERFRYRAWLRWAALVDDRIEGWGYRNARVVLVNYRSVRQILSRAYGEGLDVRLIPYAAASSFADAPGLGRTPAGKSAAPGPPVILAISRHDPRKGIDVLLHALSGLASAGIPFRAILVGGGRLLEAHRRLAHELHLGHVVSIPGEVPDVNLYLRRADIYVLPSRAEASGSVAVLEALRSGVAVVASACDGIPEDLTDGRDAVLVAPGNAAALRDAIAALLADPQRRAALAQAGRERHGERFAASRLTDALGELYRELGIAPAGVRLARIASATHNSQASSF